MCKRFFKCLNCIIYDLLRLTIITKRDVNCENERLGIELIASLNIVRHYLVNFEKIMFVFVLSQFVNRYYKFISLQRYKFYDILHRSVNFLPHFIYYAIKITVFKNQ